MSWYGRLGQGSPVDPNIVLATGVMEKATMSAKVPFKFSSIHVIFVRRATFGETVALVVWREIALVPLRHPEPSRRLH